MTNSRVLASSSKSILLLKAIATLPPLQNGHRVSTRSHHTQSKVAADQDGFQEELYISITTLARHKPAALAAALPNSVHLPQNMA